MEDGFNLITLSSIVCCTQPKGLEDVSISGRMNRKISITNDKMNTFRTRIIAVDTLSHVLSVEYRLFATEVAIIDKKFKFSLYNYVT
jgi:hypothetical protein